MQHFDLELITIMITTQTLLPNMCTLSMELKAIISGSKNLNNLISLYIVK